MAGQVGEANVAEGRSQLQRGPLALFRSAGAERLEVETGICLSGMRLARSDGVIFGMTVRPGYEAAPSSAE
jgi:hypothetical protein